MAQAIGSTAATNGTGGRTRDHGGAQVLRAPEAGDRETTPLEPAPADGPTATPTTAATADPAPQPPRRSAWRRIWRIAKIIFWLAVIVALVAGAFVGWEFYRDEVRDPVADNTAQLAATVAQLETLEERVGQLDTAAAESLPTRIEDLQTELAGLDTRVGDLESTAAGLDTAIETQTGRIDALSEAQTALAGDTAAEFETVRATELLARTRLYLYQANYGLAIADVTDARAIVAGLEPTSLLDQTALDQAVERLDRVLASLPDQPVLAADDLDVASQILLTGASVPEPAATTGADTSIESETDPTAASEPRTGSDPGDAG